METNIASKALVVLSGGQDSTTCLYWAKQHFTQVAAITFDYDQRHKFEIEAAQQIARMAEVPHEIFYLGNTLKSASPLTSENELHTYSDFEQMVAEVGNDIESTFVPLRNPMFLLFAAAQALRWDCWHLVTGICQEDNANYPDCREVFRARLAETVNLALGHSVPQFFIHAPLMHMSKAETVKLAHTMPDCWKALAYSHTSYDGKYPPTDNNHSNLLRANGFLEADLPDPLVIRAWEEGLMELPETHNYDATRERAKYLGKQKL